MSSENKRHRGPRLVGFDFTGYMRRVCQDVVQRLPEFQHVDLNRVAVGFRQTRTAGPFGMHASLTPLRFRGGHRHTVRRGKRLEIQPLRDEAGTEMLYLLNFYLPRFYDEPFEEKIETVVHELWHICPGFSGFVRSHAGRCYAHGASKSAYDAQMRILAARYLASGPCPDLLNPLKLSFAELLLSHGRVMGHKYARPRLVPVQAAAS